MEDLRRRYIKKLFKVGWNEFSTDGFFLNGIQDEGEYKKWWSNGQLSIHSFYENGKREGEYKRWHSNGQSDIHSFYKNGKPGANIKK